LKKQNNKSRLFAFGCSNTYGQGLKDCITQSTYPGPEPSLLAWPSIVAENLGLELSNQSHPGASNKEIWNQVLTNTFSGGDNVIVLWSHLERWCILHKHKSLTKIGPWLNNKISKFYYKKMHNDFDASTDFWCRANHIYSLLKGQGVSQYHLVIEDLDKLGVKTPWWNQINFLPIYLQQIHTKHPVALDGMHPGQDAHKEFALQIVDHIKKYK